MKARRLKKKEKVKRKAKKIMIPLVIIIFILMIIGIGFYIWNSNKNGISSIIFQKYSLKQNDPETTSQELLKERDFEGMQIKDISMKKEDGIVYFSANIENNTDKNFEGRDVKIKFVDGENRPIANFKTKIESIASNEAVSMQLSTSMDLTKAYNFVIE